MLSGVDLAGDLDDETVAEIRRALLDHLVVFFREQRLYPEQQAAFTRRFGPYSPVPFIEPITDHRRGHRGGPGSHRDARASPSAGSGTPTSRFSPEPPMGSILHALEVPPYGGDTLFANQYLAFDTLSRGLQTILRGTDRRAQRGGRDSPKMQQVHDLFAGMTVHTSDEANRTQLHPVVRRNPETGRDALVREPPVHRRTDEWWPTEHQAAPRPPVRVR